MMNPLLRRRGILSFLLLLVAAAFSSSFAQPSNDVVEIVAAAALAPENDLPEAQQQQPRRQLFWSLVFLGTYGRSAHTTAAAAAAIERIDMMIALYLPTFLLTRSYLPFSLL